jgi:S-adenosylmethionine-diacylgycerolhomoserine-N-methlytransferase
MAGPDALPAARESILREQLSRYYRWHAPVYDASRWLFLFGRQRLLRETAARLDAPARVLEIGVGTGRNLGWLAQRWPRAQLTGVDLSSSMLLRARRRLAGQAERLHLVEGAFCADMLDQPQDLIVLSYVLTMAGPQRLQLVEQALQALAPGGLLAVVDFDATPWPAFARWMAVNHVLIDGQLRPALDRIAPAELQLGRAAYAGMWSWLLHLHRAPAGGSG